MPIKAVMFDIGGVLVQQVDRVAGALLGNASRVWRKDRWAAASG